MRCVSALAALLLTAAAASAGGINTDSALPAGEGETTTRTRLRYVSLEQDIETYLAQQTLAYGVTPKLAVLGTLGYKWNSPGEDGLQDLAVRGRFLLLDKPGKRKTFTIAALAGFEVPIGEEPIGSPDGGLILGALVTWEKNPLRIDADFVNSLRPDAPDFRRADLALVWSFAENRDVLWQAVLEFNYERSGDADVLFVAPGLVYEIRGWKIEGSIQIAVAEDARGPAPEYAVVFSVVHVF